MAAAGATEPLGTSGPCPARGAEDRVARTSVPRHGLGVVIIVVVLWVVGPHRLAARTVPSCSPEVSSFFDVVPHLFRVVAPPSSLGHVDPFHRPHSQTAPSSPFAVDRSGPDAPGSSSAERSDGISMRHLTGGFAVTPRRFSTYSAPTPLGSVTVLPSKVTSPIGGGMTRFALGKALCPRYR